MFIEFIEFMVFIEFIEFMGFIDIAFIALISSGCPCTGVADRCRSLGAGEFDDGANGYPPVGDGDDGVFILCPGGGDMDMPMPMLIP